MNHCVRRRGFFGLNYIAYNDRDCRMQKFSIEQTMERTSELSEDLIEIFFVFVLGNLNSKVLTPNPKTTLADIIYEPRGHAGYGFGLYCRSHLLVLLPEVWSQDTAAAAVFIFADTG